jgi:hypothetical protein
VLPALALIVFFSQAEPAPAPPPAVTPPPPRPSPPLIREPEEPEEPPPWALGLTIGGAYRLAPSSTDVPPGLGLAFSTFAGRRYLTLGTRLELGVLASFSYQRFNRTVKVTEPINPDDPTRTITLDRPRTLSTGDFVAAQTFTLVLGRLRPWVALGGGLSLGHFATEETRYRPGESRPLLGFLQASAGFHLEVAPQTDGGLQVDFGHPFASAFVTESGERFQVFGDRVAVRLEMQYRF